MTMNRIIPYLIFYSITFFIFFGMHYYVFVCLNRFFVLLKPMSLILVCVALSLAFPVCSILERFYPSGPTMVLYAAASVWLGVLFLLLSVFLIYEPVRLAVNLDSKTTGMVLVGGVVLVSLYALINAALLSVKTVEVPLQGLAGPLKMVQLSDIHVGTLHNSGYLARVVDRTNALAPDLVVITGDFFDGIGPVTLKTVEPLRDLKADTFFVMGNHERYGDLDRIEGLMAQCNVRMLRNEAVEYKGVRLVGADYPERDNQKDTPYLRELSVIKDRPNILLYHQPSGIDHAVRAGIDLQVSGHTHNGQLFPFTLLAKMFFPYINGLYRVEGMYLYVSPGTGTWGPPMRLGSRNEITLFNLRVNPKVK